MKVKIFKIKNEFAIFCVLLTLFIFLSKAEEQQLSNKTNHQHDHGMYVKNILSLAKSSEMLSFMNPQQDPCYDFYDFACGNWAKINPINRARKQTSELELLKRTYERKMSALLSSNSSASDTDADRKIRTFFKSCKAAYDSFDRNQLHALVNDFGSMPLLAGENWNESKFDWLDLLARIKRTFGLQILIGLDVSADLEHGSINRIFFGQPALKFSMKSLYLEDHGLQARNAYRNEVAQQLERFTDLEHGFALHTAEEIIGFEILLAKGLIDDHANLSRAQLTIETTIDELQSKYAPTIDVRRLLNLTFGELPNGPVYEFNENYLKNLKYVLETTNPTLLANYMFFMLLQNFLPYSGGRASSSSENFCRQKVKQFFAKPLANMIYRNLNVAAADDDLKLIWHGLRKAFKAKLYSENLAWMSPKVREYAEKKLNDLHMVIDAYEERNFSADYQNLTITPNDYVKNLQQIYQYETNEMFNKINKPTTYFDGAYYDSAIPFNVLSKNMVELPVMLLQPYLLWAAHYPTVLKYGTLGFLMARALVHGFDDKGRLYNMQGEPENWWDEATTNDFMTRRDCFLLQYPAFDTEVGELDLNSENIADNAGLDLAYEAFMDWTNSEAAKLVLNSSDEILPHMSYSAEKLFFISFAQLLCNDVGPYFRPSFEQHIPGKFRVNGVLTNSKYFPNAFHCKERSTMNPTQKCKMF